jgi:cytochrome bd-type quinol oxidase subunit 2
MTVTTDVINQGIVLASILAGFAFSITAQVIMGEDKSKNAQRLSYQLLGVGLVCLFAVVIGIVYLASVDDAADHRVRGYAFLGSLGIAIFVFGWAMVEMVNSYQTDHTLRWLSIAYIITILVGIGLVVVVTITYAPRRGGSMVWLGPLTRAGGVTTAKSEAAPGRFRR